MKFLEDFAVKYFLQLYQKIHLRFFPEKSSRIPWKISRSTFERITGIITVECCGLKPCMNYTIEEPIENLLQKIYEKSLTELKISVDIYEESPVEFIGMFLQLLLSDNYN